MTPGRFNSAYYEHSFLADSMGVELVEAPDLFVDDDVVWMRTIGGPVKVDVIYRRIDDDYLDPLVFLPRQHARRAGADGGVCARATSRSSTRRATGSPTTRRSIRYMPEIVKFYTGSEAKLPNVETFRCREPQALKYVLEHLDELVVKLVDGSGGYGMLVGPTASKKEIAEFRAALEAEPHRYIAQPTLALSTVPTLAKSGLAPRHVDFRPFVLTGSKGVQVVPGGLTRVALKEGSLVVNSSQGGGTKDSFVLMPPMSQSMGKGEMTQTMGGMTQSLGKPE